MSQLDEYFNDGVPTDERLANYRTFVGGGVCGVAFLLQRLQKYCDLLDVELDEQPLAERYLQDVRTTIAQADDVLERLRRETGDVKGTESFDLLVLVQGVAARLERVGGTRIELQDDVALPEAALIDGHFFMVQHALFALVELLAAGDEGVVLYARLQDERVENGAAVGIDAGDYHRLELGRTNEPLDRQQHVPVTEKALTDADVALDERVLFLQGIIAEHRGRLLVNRPGNGLQSIIVLLPNVTGETMIADTGDTDQLRGDETILLVDDEDIVWDVVIDMLQGLGYTVLLAEHGRDCVEVYKQNPGEIDVILLDMLMPEMNGREAFYALKEIDPDVKVLLQSGYIAQDEAQDVLDAGALGFLQKPYRMVDLARAIRRVLA